MWDLASSFQWGPKHDQTREFWLSLTAVPLPVLIRKFWFTARCHPLKIDVQSVSRSCLHAYCGGIWGHFKGANWLLALGPGISGCCVTSVQGPWQSAVVVQPAARLQLAVSITLQVNESLAKFLRRGVLHGAAASIPLQASRMQAICTIPCAIINLSPELFFANFFVPFSGLQCS